MIIVGVLLAGLFAFLVGFVVGWIIRSQTVTIGDIAATELRRPPGA